MIHARRLSTVVALAMPFVLLALFLAPRTVPPQLGCSVQSYLGLPCPLCGVTRCVEHLLSLRAAQAVYEHLPFMLLLLSLSVAWAVSILGSCGNAAAIRRMVWLRSHVVLVVSLGAIAFGLAGFFWRLLVERLG